MTAKDFAQMLDCNLAESIHNELLQTSSNKGDNLYVATVDDYIQVMAYHQFLRVALGVMALSNKNSSFDVFIVVLIEPVTLLCYKMIFLTCSVGNNFALVFLILRVSQ
jgi:hypothetical protein